MKNKGIIALLCLVAGSVWTVVIQLLRVNQTGAGTVLLLSQEPASDLSKLLQQPDRSGKVVVELSDTNVALLASAEAKIFASRIPPMKEPLPPALSTPDTATSVPATVSSEVVPTRERSSRAAATSFRALPAVSTAKPATTSRQASTLTRTSLRAPSKTTLEPAQKNSSKLRHVLLPFSSSTRRPVTTSVAELPATSAGLARDLPDTKHAAGSVANMSSPNATVHVCICSDDPDFRPAIAAIRSALATSASPHRLYFHFITTPELHQSFEKMSAGFLTGVRLEVHSDAKLQQVIQNRLAKAAARAQGTRKGLLSIFNFAPFYLPQFLSGSDEFGRDTEKLIYLDGDMISLGDVASLHDQALDDMPCAAVPYCMQRLEHYVDFKQIALLGITGLDPKSCIANRGLMVINVRVWQEMRITESIGQWLQRFADAEKPLWAGGMSQPPWLLALNGKYLHLGQEWNCNGLARESMGASEAITLREEGFTSQSFKQLLVDQIGSSLEPYVATCSREANLLHFNGGMKPWLIADGETRVPVCELPVDLQFAEFSWVQHLTVLGRNDTARNFTFVRCADIFWQFVEKKPPEYFSMQADTAEMRARQQDAIYFANRLKIVREQRKRRQEMERKRMEEGRATDREVREMLAKEVLAGGFKRQTMVVAVKNITTIDGRVLVPVGRHGMVMDKIRRQNCMKRGECSETGRLLVWFRKREDKKDRPMEVLPESIRKLAKAEITKNDLTWKYRHSQV